MSVGAVGYCRYQSGEVQRKLASDGHFAVATVLRVVIALAAQHLGTECESLAIGFSASHTEIAINNIVDPGPVIPRKLSPKPDSRRTAREAVGVTSRRTALRPSGGN